MSLSFPNLSFVILNCSGGRGKSIYARGHEAVEARSWPEGEVYREELADVLRRLCDGGTYSFRCVADNP